MRIAIFDIETDGFLDVLTKMHVAAVQILEPGKRAQQRAIRDVGELLLELDDADLIVGHNIIKFDIPALQKLRPEWRAPHWSKLRDTMVLSRLIWPELKITDASVVKKGTLPPKLRGKYSLEAWGYRLGVFKSEYEGDPTIEDPAKRKAEKWLRWNQSMEDYCVQDVVATAALWDRIEAKQWAPQSILLETQVAHIIARQERHGFLFDQQKAIALYAKLAKRRDELGRELHEVFKPQFLRDGKTFTPKRDNVRMGYVAGAPFSKIKLAQFNPDSRDHIAIWLKRLHGWEPTDFTDDGKPKVDETVLGALKYPEAKLLAESFTVAKRIGQVAEGNKAWLKMVHADRRIRGGVITNGAVTGRMTHLDPNVAQVPAGYSPYGEECRDCYTVPKGKILVGADADALELRDLAGFMAKYDGGAYIETVLRGDKSKGTDMHSVNCRAIGLDPKKVYFEGETGRDIAKTWFYAFIYGAGDAKLGFILTRKKNAVKAGKTSRAAVLANLPALGRLVEAVRANAKRGFLWGLDRRQIRVRSQHAALNTLLQSAGAVQMKTALCILDDLLQEKGLVPGKHYEFVANVHDEWQIEVDLGLEQVVGETAVEAIRLAGERLGFRCPLAGQWKSGPSWAATH